MTRCKSCSAELLWVLTERGKAAQTHCLRGHPFDERNTLWHHGRRECRACNALRARRRRAEDNVTARKIDDDARPWETM